MDLMTKTQRSRVIQALDETQCLLAREMRYADDLRKQDLIAFYESHIAKLTGMLEGRVDFPSVSMMQMRTP